MRRIFPILALLCMVSCNKQADIPARQEVTELEGPFDLEFSEWSCGME